MKIRFQWTGSSRHMVMIAGSWSNWTKQMMFPSEDSELWSVGLELPPGEYNYKFIVDGVWQHDPNQVTVMDEYGGCNNFVKVPQNQLNAKRPAGQLT